MTSRHLAALGLVGAVTVGACTAQTAEPGANQPCPGLRTDERTTEFLDSWTQPQRLRAPACVLPGRPAPPPEFNTRPLGEEQRLYPDRLPGDQPLPPHDLPGLRLVDGYPIVHVGQIEDTDSHLFLAWRGTPASPVACVGSVAEQCEESSEVAGEPGVRAYGRGSTREVTLDIRVPPGTSVVGLKVEGRPEAWQRPVALIAQLSARLAWAGPDDFARFGRDGLNVEVTYLDAEGKTIRRDVFIAAW